MKWTPSKDGGYIWENVVIPNWFLIMTTDLNSGSTTEEESQTFLVGFNAGSVSCFLHYNMNTKGCVLSRF